ncbi:MAG: TetR/AcrR family transcriptional regulator [Alphaproteobacteria bacterium]|nr:TetR/AcrR family transcriptional regulator [Alphaproteobacteria bacterium]
MTRVRNAAATREKILVAARSRFLADSYDTVGLREIAADAGVDVALVGRYFGSKESLFKEVLRGSEGPLIDGAMRAADLPAFLASLATQEYGPQDAEHVERLLIILRSASSPKAAAIVKQAISEDVLEPIAGLLSGDEAQIRASMALSVLMGTTILRTIMAVEPLSECNPDSVRRNLTAMLAAALAVDSSSGPGVG